MPRESTVDCSTIIVSYNTFDLTKGAIRTALEAAPGLRHEIIVVDNASPDGSGTKLAAAFAEEERVTVVQNPENPGFSAANNRGAAVARGETLFFLNPDTLVHSDAIRVLVEFLRAHPEAGAVGPRVLNADGSVQTSAMAFPTPGWMIRHHLPLKSLLKGSDRRLDPIPQEVEPVDVVKGCALAISAAAFNQTGGWDESYFMYAEETELCQALKRRGYVNYHVPEAVITHFGGAASLDRYAEEQVKIARSTEAFLRRHSPAPHIFLYRITGLAGFALRTLIFSYLHRARPARSAEYARRRDAALALVRWFLRGD